MNATHSPPRSTAEGALLEISNLLTEFSRCIDARDRAALSLLFGEGAVLDFNGFEMRGRDAIRKGTPRSSQARGTTRHLWTNLQILSASADRIRTRAMQMTLEQGEGASLQVRVSDLSDEFAKGGDGRWLFASRIMTRQIDARSGVAE
ncbi:MAG: nuclear transport factor 2 family protein [Alcaligenaceae bacterium]|nr:nuclear transport factor 2 family protein [Alcaligenaceae bacterium SAGV5]MPS54703.1 nuclear transport factor 2 family protein [Alcaligenaceae bacterium SAGV3]MPT59811.1 nuclear transport factor 2 family protein [Alcaligenaceae bacterium]